MTVSYYTSSDWLRFKVFIQALAGPTCEFCELRPSLDLHHVTYSRFGAEHPSDVMLLCRECHSVMHGKYKGKIIKYKRGSLFHQRLSEGDLLEYILEKREAEWAIYKKRAEGLAEVTGEGVMLSEGEVYFAR